jgi:deoxyribonuclease-4
MSFSKLFFGTAGMPHSTSPPSTLHAISRLKELGLEGMELEFVHSVNLTEQSAGLVKAAAEKNGINLTCHGSYYINLNSLDKAIVGASRSRIVQAAKIASLAGAVSVTFHAAFYLKDSPKDVFAKVKHEIERINQEMNAKNIRITLRPETTGKATQFGSLEELLELSSQIDNVLPCIDFSHLHARTNGKMNSYEEFRGILEQSEKVLGKEFLKNLHCHVSGIEYSAKGERNHLVLSESDFKYKELLRALKEFDCKGIIVCESPNIEDDALLMQKTYSEL